MYLSHSRSRLVLSQRERKPGIIGFLSITRLYPNLTSGQSRTRYLVYNFFEYRRAREIILASYVVCPMCILWFFLMVKKHFDKF